MLAYFTLLPRTKLMLIHHIFCAICIEQHANRIQNSCVTANSLHRQISTNIFVMFLLRFYMCISNNFANFSGIFWTMCVYWARAVARASRLNNLMATRKLKQPTILLNGRLMHYGNDYLRTQTKIYSKWRILYIYCWEEHRTAYYWRRITNLNKWYHRNIRIKIATHTHTLTNQHRVGEKVRSGEFELSTNANFRKKKVHNHVGHTE